MKILIAEDELDMQKIIRLYLEQSGHQVSLASNGMEAWDMLCTHTYDLLICDWMMPKMSGVDLCREIRASSLPVKIIMLTAKSQISDEITGLKCGADDYIRKPFEPQVLLLRIQKLLRLEPVLKCGKIMLNQEEHTVYVGDKELKVTQKEWHVLLLFMKNKGITLSRNKLIESVWGMEYDGDERTLDTHIRRLRSKIGEEYITTFIGVGYRFGEPHE